MIRLHQDRLESEKLARENGFVLRDSQTAGRESGAKFESSEVESEIRRRSTESEESEGGSNDEHLIIIQKEEEEEEDVGHPRRLHE